MRLALPTSSLSLKKFLIFSHPSTFTQLCELWRDTHALSLSYHCIPRYLFTLLIATCTTLIFLCPTPFMRDTGKLYGPNNYNNEVFCF